MGLVLASDPNVLAQTTSRYDVRSYGATGNGRTLDTTAVQRAIDGAAKDGGGIVHFPAGSYLSFSLRLRSQVTLEFAPGSTLLAATPDFSVLSRQYDAPEAQPVAIVPYQDYGHNHWQNSLLWGENLHDIAIVGQGLIWGRGLQKGDGPEEERAGAGNKAISLKNCRNVLLRDISILDPGHFGVLASGVNNITIDNVRIDTRRDGIDIDGCRNVHITNCTVNAPWDDGIVLKSSYSLGELRSAITDRPHQDRHRNQWRCSQCRCLQLRAARLPWTRRGIGRWRSCGGYPVREHYHARSDRTAVFSSARHAHARTGRRHTRERATNRLRVD
jgi:polygalacturonase